MNTMQKLIAKGISDVMEFEFDSFLYLHPNIEYDGELFLGTLRGKQRLLMVKDRYMNNSDGAEWTRPYQTKTCLYYLDRDGYSSDENNEEPDPKDAVFTWYWEEDLS